MIRQVEKNGKKKKKFSLATVFKYGIEVPKNSEHEKRITESQGNTFWQDAYLKPTGFMSPTL